MFGIAHESKMLQYVCSLTVYPTLNDLGSKMILLVRTWSQLRDPGEGLRVGCGWESKREKPLGLQPALVRRTTLLLYYSCGVLSYKPHFRLRLKWIWDSQQRFTEQNNWQSPHEAVFGSSLKALLGQQQGSFQALLWLLLLFLKVQLYKQVTGDVHLHHIVFSTARCHTQPAVGEKLPNPKGKFALRKEAAPENLLLPAKPAL